MEKFLSNSTEDRKRNAALIDVYPNKSRGSIDPNLYGLHLEHIWNCVYPSVWVGHKSPIPNTDGIRNDVAELLAALHPAVCKYPGGYFTDIYDWRDGVGPSEQRPVRVCPTQPNREESNQFGTAEFIRFCRMIGAEPFLSVNATSIEPSAAGQWVEYCNLDGNTYWAAKRREHGYREPFRVRYWAIGNEQYLFHSAEEYAGRYSRWAHFMCNTDPEITLVSSGIEPGYPGSPWNSDGTWGERFMRMTLSGQWLYNGDWNLPSDAQRKLLYSVHPYFFSVNAECTDQEYYRALTELDQRLLKIIDTTVKLLDIHRGKHPRPRLCFDEYGLLHSGWSMAGNMTQPAPFWAAIWLGCFFQICHEHPVEVGMATLPGIVNMEHELLLIEEGRVVATPSYYLFKLYRPHGGAESLETVVSGVPQCGEMGRKSLWPLASLRKNGCDATLSVINLDLKQSVSAEITFHDRRIKAISGNILNSPDIHARNTSEAPFQIIPCKVDALIDNGRAVYTFPAHSVTVFDVRLETG